MDILIQGIKKNRDTYFKTTFKMPETENYKHQKKEELILMSTLFTSHSEKYNFTYMHQPDAFPHHQLVSDRHHDPPFLPKPA